MERFDTVIIGAGAAGMFCAAQAGQAGNRVLLIDNGKTRRKILMSGGGRCNFTNMYVEPAAYLSQNPHFCKSALARYTQWDFIDLVNKHGIAWHEKTLGQLFCDDSAQQIVDMLVAECEQGNVTFRLRSEVLSVCRGEDGFIIELNGASVAADKLVIASGGLSMPGLGASPLGYKIAEQFGLRYCRPVPGWCHLPYISHYLNNYTFWQAFRCHPLSRRKTAKCFVKIFSLPTVAFLVRQCYKFPVTGNPVSL